MRTVIFTILSISFVAMTSVAAIPDKAACTTKTTIAHAQDIANIPAANLMWDCMEISALPKEDLLALADIAPKLSLQLSKSNLDRTAFNELQKKVPVELTVDSTKLSRMDLVEMEKNGVQLTIHSSDTILNAMDLAEIASTRPITVVMKNPIFSFSDLSDIAKNKKITLIIDGKLPNLSARNVDELIHMNPDMQFIP